MLDEHDTSYDQNNTENIVGNDNMNLADKDVEEIDDDGDNDDYGSKVVKIMNGVVVENLIGLMTNWANDYVFQDAKE